ncbi:MAG: PIG-L family deacetylase [Anaerolineae bacterium]|nr:PIG-L family deacetylase [Anaerolineae bacterium]
MADQLRILAFGAHPDDCDIRAGGLAIKYARLGHQVKFVSLTNGDTGHFSIGGGPLARRRQAEAQCSGRNAGIEYQVVDIHNGQLMPTVENRWLVVRIIREFRPDLVITNRPNDYHPDHRYASQLVADASYTVTIPNVQALTPHLMYNPVVAYWGDSFRRPYPFTPDVAVSIDDVVETKLSMLHCHTSQMYEWLPYNQNKLEQVPEGDAERRAWMAEQRLTVMAKEADRARDLLVQLYGEQRGRAVQYAESLEFGEYGGKVDEVAFRRLFPFFD